MNVVLAIPTTENALADQTASEPTRYIPRSKLTVPRCQATPRPHLVTLIESGARRKLVLVSAPAGWGKTSLLSEWAAQTPLPVAWVSLESADSSPTRFWRNVAAAIDTVHPGIVDDVLALLQTPAPPIIDSVVAALIDSVATLGGDATLILDDYHLIDSPAVHESLAYLIHHLPPPLHVVIATRSDPAFRLSRLRAQGELTELRAADLRFHVAEAKHLFSAMPSVKLGDTEIAALVERTEGWATGLQLTALSLAGRADARGFVHAFAGTQRDIADYLSDEVLARQPEEVTSFLLSTSILDRLTAKLCDAVSGRTDGQEMLEWLELHNLFIEPLDDHRRWYRYHGLFAELLRERLQHVHPDQVSLVHHRAAAWYEDQDLPLEACQHAILAGDLTQAAIVLERSADQLLWNSGEVLAFLQWLDALPAAVQEAHPRLMRSRAWALTLAGRHGEADEAVSEIEQRLKSNSPHENGEPPATTDSLEGIDVLHGETAAIRSRIAAVRSDHETAAILAEQSLTLVPRSHGRLRSDVSLNLGYANLVLGRLNEANAALVEAVNIGWSSSNSRAALFGIYYLAQVQLAKGSLREAHSFLADELERLDHEPGTNSVGPAIAILRVGLSEALYEQNELFAARHQLERAVNEGRRGGDAKTLIYAYHLLSRVYHATGDPSQATDTLRRGISLANSPWSRMERARLALQQSDLLTAKRLVGESGLGISDEPAPGDETHYATFAHLLITQKQYDDAVDLLERRLTSAESCGRIGRAINFLALLAIAQRSLGNHQAAVSSLGRALSYAAPEGYVRTFLDLGAPMADLLRDALRAARRSSNEASTLPMTYAQSLLTALAQPKSERQEGTGTQGILESLTEREAQILELVADGRTNQQIATDLYIASGTVKAHLNHIYGKLLASNRTEAVTNARRFGILPD